MFRRTNGRRHDDPQRQQRLSSPREQGNAMHSTHPAASGVAAPDGGTAAQRGRKRGRSLGADIAPREIMPTQARCGSSTARAHRPPPPRFRLAACVALMTLAPAAHAAGFFINQQSVRGLGRVNAGVAAAADDPSTIFFNPAGLAYLWCDDAGRGKGGEAAPAHLPCNDAPRDQAKSWASIGVQLIIPRSELTNSGSVAATPGTLGNLLPSGGTNFNNPTDPTPVPNIYFARRLANGDGFVGLGIGAPFGLAAKFSNDWFGRYDSIEASLTTINVSAVVAYRLNPAVSIGGGIDLQYAKTKLVAAIPDPLTPGGPTVATDGKSTIEGTAWTPGFNVGIMFSLDPATRLGLDFRSGMNHRISGDATISNLTGFLAPANGEVGANATLRLPAIAGIGLVRQATEKLTLYAQFDWYGWSTFDEIRVAFDDGRPDAVRVSNYRDTWAASVGADFAASDAWILRGGVRYDRTPTVDGFRDTTFADADRLWLGLGGSYRISPSSAIDVAFNHVFFRNAAINVTRGFFDGTPLASSAQVRGNADSVVNTVSINYSRSF
jgi:long-chain fatty acid transport protein